jgi:phage terminase large subunit-like protein
MATAKTDYCAIANEYIASVLAGKEVVSEWVRLACQRQVDNLAQWATDGPYRFDEAAANRVCWFAEQLQHVKSSVATKAGDKIRLQRWQVFILTTVYGWLWRNSGTRRFRRAFLLLGRGNGKSTLASICALYAFCQNEGGAQVVTAASVLSQARIVLDDARDMVKGNKALAARLGLEVTANEIQQPATNSTMWSLSKSPSAAEGLSISTAVLDEVHCAGKGPGGRQLHDVLSTGTTKKRDSLFWLVTTAGFSDGLGEEICEFLQQVLLGEANDESYAAFLFCVDPADDWRDPQIWPKANPGLNISVDENALAEECNRARQLPGLAAAFRTHHLCQWLANGGADAFLPQDLVRACYQDLREEDFVGQPCAGGLDLSRRLDLTSYVRLYSRRDKNGKLHHYAFNKNWIPEKTARESTVSAYANFIARRELVCQPGSTIDLDFVEEFLMQDIARHPNHKYRNISFDPMESGTLCNHLRKRTGREDLMVETPQSSKYMTPGAIFLQSAVASGTFHTNSALLLWCLQNLHCKNYSSNLIQPIRNEDRTLKTDAATACLLACRSIALVPLEDSGPLLDPFKKKAIYSL